MESKAHRIMIMKQATIECNPMINRTTKRKAAMIYEDEVNAVLDRLNELEEFEYKFRHLRIRRKYKCKK